MTEAQPDEDGQEAPEAAKARKHRSQEPPVGARPYDTSTSDSGIPDSQKRFLLTRADLVTAALAD